MSTSIARIQAATTGMETDTSLEFVDKHAAPLIRNYLTHKTGKLMQRGGLSIGAAIGSTNGAGPVRGGWWYGDNFIYSAPSSIGGASVVRSATVNAVGAVTDNGAVAGVASGTFLFNPWARLDEYIYGIGTSATVTLGILYSKANFNLLSNTNAPYIAADVATYASRLFVLGGTTPGTGGAGTVYPNRLYWSDPGGPTTGTLAEWQDNVSGLVNQLVIPDDTGIGLSSIGRALVVFMNNSVHVLTGSGSSTFAVHKVLNRGATNRDAICTFGDATYFLSRDGLYYFDGVTARNVSSAVESKISQKAGYVLSGKVADIGNGYLYVATFDNGTFRWQGLYHTVTGAWHEFKSSAINQSVPELITSSNGHVVLLDKIRIHNAATMTLTLGADSFDYDGTTFLPIDARWTTRTIRLAGPSSKAIVRRLFFDYVYTSAEAASTNVFQWTLYTAPSDGSSTTATTVATGYLTENADSTQTRQRLEFDINEEVEDLWIEIDTVGHLPANPGPIELYDIWVEFEGAQPAHGW